MGGAPVEGGDIGGGQPWEGGWVLVQVAALAGQQPPAVFQHQHSYHSQPDVNLSSHWSTFICFST